MLKRKIVDDDKLPMPAPSKHDNNNNSHDNVYGADIMTKVIARVHPVHLMDAD